MKAGRFTIIGENIHCTRVFKRGGKFVTQDDPDGDAVLYTCDGETRRLPIPDPFRESADWEAGKVKHCAVAVWHGMHGGKAGEAVGADYLRALARKQAGAGADFLDVNVDEFTTDVDERIQAMRWAARVVQDAVAVPLSIDSSNTSVLKAGLELCDPARARPMVNSVSLERVEAIDVAAEFKAVVVASAAGETDLPCTAAGRLDNLDVLMGKLDGAGFDCPAIYVDPLVFPIATDSNNGKAFLDAVAAIRRKYGADIHIVGGLSNVSFGMPGRKLINQAFTCLAVEAGADGGIVDPLQINRGTIEAADTESEGFRLAKALLTGEDMFGAEFIMAYREGRLE